ncbi:MAG: DUF3352 domain-containing protein [Candidatus Gracilibacteria bacterium]
MSKKHKQPKEKKHEHKAELAKPEEPKQQPKKSTLPFKNKLINGGILLVILMAFSLMAIFMAQKVLEPTNLGNILPANQTVAFVTINTSDLSTKTTLPEDYSLSPTNLEQTIAGYFNQESFDLLKDWFKSQAAIALMIGTNQEVEKTYFFEYQDRNTALQFLESITTEDEAVNKESYGSYTIYSYSLSQNFSAALIANYLVISEDPVMIKLIMDTAEGDASNLKSLSAYNTVMDNLPYDATGVVFWNVKLYPDLAASYIPIYDIIPEALITPVMSIFTGFGAVIQAAPEGFYMQTYTTVDKNLLEDLSYFGFVKKYNANLTAYIPSGSTMFFGGENIQGEVKKAVSIFKKFNESAAIIFEGVIRGAVKQYFGENIDLDADIYPILEDEYSVSVYDTEDGGKAYLVLVDLQNQDDKQIHIDTLNQGFLEQQIYSEPYVKTYTLEDGSEGKEIVADLAEILNEKITYDDSTIDMFYLSNGDTLGYTAVSHDKFAMSTDLDLLKQSLDLMSGLSATGSFAESENMAAISAIMGSADEASLMDINSMRDSSEFWGIEFFSPFSQISSSKNFFDDGVATFHMLKY